MNGFSFERFLAVLHKEWIQVRRDPMTLRLIIALPVMQLFLFGYAINTDPKHLPTGLLSSEHSQYVRTIVAALRNTGYYDIRPFASEEAGESARWPQARSCSSSTSRPISSGRSIAARRRRSWSIPTPPIPRQSATQPRRSPR